MKCPCCTDHDLTNVTTKNNIEVSYCNSCKGIWLDKGQLLHFVKNPRKVQSNIDNAKKTGEPTMRKSPRTGLGMVQMQYPDGPKIDYCQTSGGLWFDANELKAIQELESADIQPAAPASQKIAPERVALAGAPQATFVKTALAPLPNLFLYSTMALVGLYGILTLILITAIELEAIPANLGFSGLVLFAFLQFAIGPFLMDWSLRWLYSLEFVELAGMPEHLQLFVTKLCAEKGINVPRFGIINDSAPQAFTYGHTPNNARVVLSKGILELLEPEEVEAVVAHEIGHAVHWDMLLMTVMQLVPMILYYVYRAASRSERSSSNNKGGGAKAAISVGAYVLYIITEYVVLWFSRVREYHADRFAGEVTGNPTALANALVKIAYGLAGKEGAKKDEKESGNLSAIGALGIFDKNAAQSLALTTYSKSHNKTTSPLDKETIKGAMRWDFWNPWAKWYELHSTHPLVANRLKHLSNQAMHMGQEPYIMFDEKKPESYWDEFLVDLVIHILPFLSIVAGILYAVIYLSPPSFAALSDEQKDLVGIQMLAAIAVFLGGGLLVRWGFIYRGRFFPEMSVAALLKKVKVSAVRPVPCQLKGKIIGRGMPGYILSEDFVMQDETGIIFLDYTQPLAIWEFFFGLLRAGRYTNKEVLVEGWYHRAPVPYVKIKRISCEGKTSKSYVPMMQLLTACTMIVGGLYFYAFPMQ